LLFDSEHVRSLAGEVLAHQGLQLLETHPATGEEGLHLSAKEQTQIHSLSAVLPPHLFLPLAEHVAGESQSGRVGHQRRVRLGQLELGQHH
jgi:hypothetical protein